MIKVEINSINGRIGSVKEALDLVEHALLLEHMCAKIDRYMQVSMAAMERAETIGRYAEVALDAVRVETEIEKVMEYMVKPADKAEIERQAKVVIMRTDGFYNKYY